MAKEKKYKPYSKKELSNLYGISGRTLYAWLLPIRHKLGLYKGRTFSPSQVRKIFDFLGEPEEL